MPDFERKSVFIVHFLKNIVEKINPLFGTHCEAYIFVAPSKIFDTFGQKKVAKIHQEKGSAFVYFEKRVVNSY